MQGIFRTAAGGRMSLQAFSFGIAALFGYFTFLQIDDPAASTPQVPGGYHSTASASATEPQPDVLLVPAATETATALPTATASPSATPDPPTPTPTQTAAPVEVVEPPTATPEPPTATPELPTPTPEPPTPTPEPPEPAQSQNGPYPRGAVGYDISFPQCPDNFPLNAAYGIIGVTGGKAYTANPCFADELAWAQTLASPAALYTNTSNSGPANENWGKPGPLPCANPAANNDLGCAYNFGWNGAAHAFELAATVTSSPASFVWWLDVETENTWAGTHEANSAAIQGFYNYLKSRGVPIVGIYSTGYQWNLITGGLLIAEAPNWVAGASSTDDVLSFCNASFSGGPVWLVQFQIAPFHGDYACPL